MILHVHGRVDDNGVSIIVVPISAALRAVRGLITGDEVQDPRLLRTAIDRAMLELVFDLGRDGAVRLLNTEIARACYREREDAELVRTLDRETAEAASARATP